MKPQILLELKNLEQQHQIKILYAVESGSRAWGFASENSDWDVRFIYVHKRDWYLSIDNFRDSIEVMLPGDLDLSGWELRKALKLFRKSNPPLLEWLNSPIVYLEEPFAMNQFREAAAEFFNPKSCLYHYLSMAVNNFKEYLTRERVRTKKYFYVLRPILACMWIERTGTMAPTEFQKLFENEVQDEELRAAVLELLEKKRAGGELGEGERIDVLNEFLESKIAHFTQYLAGFDFAQKPDNDRLNSIFRSTLDEFETAFN